MLFRDRAIDELNRAGKLPACAGSTLGTNINHRDLDDPLFEPIFARIEALDLPIFLHPLQVVGGPAHGAVFACQLAGISDRHGHRRLHLILAACWIATQNFASLSRTAAVYC